jgi:hypothetical protein
MAPPPPPILKEEWSAKMKKGFRRDGDKAAF